MKRRNRSMDSLVQDLRQLAATDPNPQQRQMWHDLLKMSWLKQTGYDDEQREAPLAPPIYGHLGWRDDDLLDALDAEDLADYDDDR